MEDFSFAWSFISSSKHRSKHNSISTCSKCFYNISRILDPTVSNNRFTIFARNSCSIVDSCYLRNTNTSNHTSSTDRTWSNTNLNNVYTRFIKGTCTFSSSNISSNQSPIWEMSTNLGNFTQDTCRMTMCSINNNRIRSCLKKSLCTFKCI
ncbi:Uncharacterised protein [Streptococcus pneumoniae]|nr:Uncharacterised protein [Streptococcus pneumoniae]CIV93300.1 Uncharacterised protein [Streptococcus pneumoniae]CRF29890.1 Uncharacterised protein [Streptococcus pneumoniae]